MKTKKVILAIAIAIIFAFFIGYGIEVFHEGPERDDYCLRDPFIHQNKSSCESAGGSWLESASPEHPTPSKTHCRDSKKCYDEFEQDRTKHDKIVFIVSIIAGVLGVFGSFFVRKDLVANGILGGAVLIILYGTIRYWQHANDILKFILLGFALGILIWLGYNKIEKR